MHRTLRSLLVMTACFALACGSTPKQTVELSQTVGTDLASMQARHRDLVHLTFERMRRDVNRFVDNAYAPYQLRAAIARQEELAVSSDPAKQNLSLPRLMSLGIGPSASQESQTIMMKALHIFLASYDADVDSKRREMLKPIDEQETEVTAALNTSYQRLLYANAVVTAHLQSLVDLEQARDEALEQLGFQKQMSERLAAGLANASDHIGEIAQQAERFDSGLDELSKKSQEIKDIVAGIGAPGPTKEKLP